jgi:large subunit ribosomal protein L19
MRARKPSAPQRFLRRRSGFRNPPAASASWLSAGSAGFPESRLFHCVVRQGALSIRPAISGGFAVAIAAMNARAILEKIESEHLKKKVPSFNVGDTVKVHTRVVEGGKERIQIFQGIVLSRCGAGLNSSFTVRKISYGEGVERVFPLHSPGIARIDVVTKGRVRRAKLNYLRTRVGKSATQVKSAGREATVPAEGSEE